MTHTTLSPPTVASDLALELLALMEVAVFRRVAPKSYALEGLAPGFYTRLFPKENDGSDCRAPWNHSPMLEFFLGEAEAFFESGPKPGDSLSSGLWVENQDSGEEQPLTATARALKSGQILLIQSAREEYAQRIRLLRRSRADIRSRADLMEKRKVTKILQKSIQHKSPLDPVTKLYNRETLLSLLQAQVANLSLYAPNLALIAMSLDQLEGPGEGQPSTESDRFLRQIGHVLRQSLRKSDSAVHYGGGVFFIVAPGTTLPQAILAAERLMKLFQGHDFGSGRPLNLYMGCTAYRLGEEAREFVVRARQALLEAVKTGPNTVGQLEPGLLEPLAKAAASDA